MRRWIVCHHVVIAATGVRVVVTWSGGGGWYEGDAGSTGSMW
jgi:hypothetical protein